MLKALVSIEVFKVKGRDQSCTNPATARLGQTGMMTTNSFCRISVLQFFMALLVWGAAHSASAQVGPELRRPQDLSLFSTFTDAKPNFRYLYDRAVYGFSLGGFLQTGHTIGIEARGSILRWGSDQHEESALAGPRAALHFGRISPYACVLLGAANAWSRNLPGAVPGINEAVGFQWSVVGGLDVHLKHHVSLRVADLSYSKIYLSQRTLTQLTASAGFVYRIN